MRRKMLRAALDAFTTSDAIAAREIIKSESRNQRSLQPHFSST